VVTCLRCNEVAAQRDGAPRNPKKKVEPVSTPPPPPPTIPASKSSSSLGGDFVPLTADALSNNKDRKRVNLLELEQERKKKKKVTSNVGAGHSLTALAGLFSQTRK